MVVLGHKHVAGISYWAPIPSAAKDMLYFAIMYAGATPSHCWLRFRAGDRLKMRGSADFCRCGTAVRVKRNVPRTLISCMRSRSEEHTSELQSRFDLVCRLLLEKKTLAYYAT